MTKYVQDSSNFGADGPFFHVIREGLQGLVQGEDFFDLLADDVVFEYVISVPGYPARVESRQKVIEFSAAATPTCASVVRTTSVSIEIQ